MLGRVIGPGQEPRGLLHREAERHRLPLRAQVEEIAGRRRRAEDARHRARMKAAVVERDRIEGIGDAGRHLDAEHDRGEEAPAVAVLPLGHGQAGGHDHRQGVKDRPDVKRLDVAVVGERAVGERRADARGPGALPDQRRLPRAAQLPDESHHDAAGRIPGGGGREHGADRVEEIELGVGDDVGGQVPVAKARDALGERA